MKKVTFQELSQDYLNQLVKGAFLTVKHEGKVNAMTIGWGTLGYMWNRPIMMVPVRFSRYTHTLIHEAQSFTVSVPIAKDLKKALTLCGTKSGRELDKIDASGLTLAAPQSEAIETPVIAECELHIECKIVFKQAMDLSLLSDQIASSHYGDGDEHVLYYGEILAAYYTGE
ncbi:MAG TPA: flavin reductase [Clostridiales bacterium UBA8960]|nr:flavin reductase [Clostridiales bacterium UBA8960]